MKFSLQLLLCILIFTQSSIAQFNRAAVSVFKNHNLSLSARLTKYDSNHSNEVVNQLEISINDENTAVTFGDSKWDIKTDIQANPQHSDRYDVSLIYTCISGNSPAS